MTVEDPASIIISDIDGVLANTMDSLLAELWYQFHVPIKPEDITMYDFAESLGQKIGMHPETLRGWVRNHLWTRPEFWCKIRPYWAMHEALLTYQTLGGALYFFTNRGFGLGDESIRQATVAWLNTLDFARTRLDGRFATFCKDTEGKVSHAGSITDCHTDSEVYVIEDNPEVIQVLIAAKNDDTFYNPDRVHPLLIGRPWSRHTSLAVEEEDQIISLIQRLTNESAEAAE